MRNRYELLELARANGVAVKKRLKTWPKDGRLVVLEVDRPIGEVAEELRARGLIR